ncbi:hypothetical protein AAFO92_05530 [Roseovarius sp. CAU 1744]
MKPRSLLKLTFALIAVLFVITGLAVLNSFKRFDLRFNPIANEIRNGLNTYSSSERVALIPELFMPGELREAVVKKLNNAGFERTPSSQVWMRYQNEINVGREVFTREANRFPCNIRMYVFLGFDGQGDLETAQGTQHEHGCM